MTTGLPRDEKIYVAGHRGLAGSALMRELGACGCTNLLTRTHAELDLTDRRAVREFFQTERPQYVFMAAAKVGGIVANNTYPAEFIAENLAIQTNVIHEAWRADVKRLLFLGSSCIYPRDCPQPIRESYLLTGPLEPTNRPYALAKIAGVEMCWSYNRQYGTRFLAAMPTNLYGPGDNYDLQNSHVLPALIRKFHEAKARGDRAVTLWGTGAPRREFLYSDDMAAACVFLMGLDDEAFEGLINPESATPQPPLINIGCGEDFTIRELAEKVRNAVGFTGAIDWDPSKPDGTPRKLLDVGRLLKFSWRPRIDLDQGITESYRDFLRSSVASTSVATAAPPPRHSSVGQDPVASDHSRICIMSLDTSALKPGLKAATEIVVGTRDTAPHVGSGKIKVLATPIMVNMMEEAALNAVEGLLPEGHQTVGTRLDITHTAATPVGMRVTARAELIKVDGRKLTFRVSAEDEREVIGEGVHERIIVNVARFDKRAQDKAGKS